MPDLGQLAAALSLKTGDIGGDGFVSERWNAGNGFTFVPVKGLEAIARARPDMGRWSDAIGPNDPQGVFLFCREVAEKGHSFHARMFAPGLGVLEDPATGSAAAAFAGPLSAAGPGDGQHAYTIEQGYEMGRPSLLNLTLSIRGGSLAGAVVGGDAVLVSRRRHRGLTLRACCGPSCSMTGTQVIAIERLELRFAPRPWPFAERRRAEIAAHFAERQRQKPALFNGTVLVLGEHAIDGAVFRGSYLPVRLRELSRLARLGPARGRRARLLRAGRAAIGRRRLPDRRDGPAHRQCRKDLFSVRHAGPE